MRKVSLAIALLVAALATAGQMRNPSNPLTAHGSTIHADIPPPPCPPDCNR